jgi:hypothetical protein
MDRLRDHRVMDWHIKNGRFEFVSRKGGKFSAKKKPNADAARPKAAPSFDAAEQKIQPKKSGKAFGKPR